MNTYFEKTKKDLVNETINNMVNLIIEANTNDAKLYIYMLLKRVNKRDLNHFNSSLKKML